MNPREEKNKTPKGDKQAQNDFAAANDAANVQEDYQNKPMDKTEGRMNNGELGANFNEERKSESNS